MPNLSELAAPLATRRAFRKHSILLYQGEVPRMAYVVKSGVVKMYSINNWGEEQVVSFYGPNEFFSASWVFDKASTSLYYYETITECEILMLPKSELNKILKSPKLIESTLDYFVTKYTGQLMRITALEQSRAREKVMFILYYLLFRYGVEIKSGKYKINFPLTHKLIASTIGLTRETTSNEISKLKTQKVLSYAGTTYIIDKQQLEQHLGEDSFKDIVI